MILRHAFIAFLIALALCAAPSAAFGAELPQWEAGLGATVITMPDYRGSDHSRRYVFPIPYLVYRGDVLKVDRRAIRGVFFKSERVEVDTSMNGAPPVKSSENGARQGMPDLDATLEAGPSLKIKLGEDRAAGYRAELQFPLRASFATDFSYLRYTGLVFSPRLNFDWARLTPGGRWSAGFALGPVFIDTRNARHYYSVDALYAAPGRPEYDAHGGYAGMQLSLAGTIKTDSVWIGVFSRIDNLGDARFGDSPLVKARWSVTAGLALAWVFGTSEVRVKTEEW